MKVKICGLTNMEDALAAIEAGADMLGFNFYPASPRYIAPRRCARITAALRARRVTALMVGVFVDAPASAIDRILQECGLHLAQLHGDETPATMQALEGKAFKAIRPQTLAEARAAARRFAHFRASSGPALLVDACQPGKYGGTGTTSDWELARSLASQVPILLAGGLTPENVSAALGQVEPWGADVASGVESSPGRKDPGKIQAFMRAVHSFEGEEAKG